MTKETILGILRAPHLKTGAHENRYLIYRMLQALYQRQTASEQVSHTTHHKNNVGFNAIDAGWLTDVARRSVQYNNLTPKQAVVVGKRLVKYAEQLANIAAENKQTKLPVAEVVAVPMVCSRCGCELPKCDCYWDHEFQKREIKQEELAFMSGLRQEEAL